MRSRRCGSRSSRWAARFPWRLTGSRGAESSVRGPKSGVLSPEFVVRGPRSVALAGAGIALSRAMVIWSLSFLCFFLGIGLLRPWVLLAPLLGASREALGLRQAVDLLHELQETLESGILPQPER